MKTEISQIIGFHLWNQNIRDITTELPPIKLKLPEWKQSAQHEIVGIHYAIAC